MESDIGGALRLLPSAGFWALGLNALLNNLVNVLLVVAVVIVFFVLIIGGIKWATSHGDKEAVSSAQKTITAAIIGLVIIFSAWAIVTLLKNIFRIGLGPATIGQPGTSLPITQSPGSPSLLNSIINQAKSTLGIP